MTPEPGSFSSVFAQALRGVPCSVVGLGEHVRLPVARWTHDAGPDDELLLAQCVGPTLDIGCGPGRLTAALAVRGHVTLGIDVVPEAVGQTRDRGGTALRRDVFDDLPGQGRWCTALLADGNIGIGGDPEALLRRVRQLLDPRGRVVVEVAAPGVPDSTRWAALECAGVRSKAFLWSVVGVDGIDELAGSVGLGRSAVHRIEDRWCAVLEESA